MPASGRNIINPDFFVPEIAQFGHSLEVFFYAVAQPSKVTLSTRVHLALPAQCYREPISTADFLDGISIHVYLHVWLVREPWGKGRDLYAQLPPFIIARCK